MAAAAHVRVFDVDSFDTDVPMALSPIEIEQDGFEEATLASIDVPPQMSEKVRTPEPVPVVSEVIDLAGTSSPIQSVTTIDVPLNSPQINAIIRSEADEFLRSMGSIV